MALMAEATRRARYYDVEVLVGDKVAADLTSNVDGESGRAQRRGKDR